MNTIFHTLTAAKYIKHNTHNHFTALGTLYNLRTKQYFSTISLSGWMFLLALVHPGCPGQNPKSRKTVVCVSLSKFSSLTLGLAPYTSYSTHFFNQSLPSFHSTCLDHCNLFCCSTKIMSSNPSHSLHPLLGTQSCSLTLHIHLTILISAHWSATSFSFLTALQARSHFHATYYFAQNCCRPTIPLSLWMIYPYW